MDPTVPSPDSSQIDVPPQTPVQGAPVSTEPTALGMPPSQSSSMPSPIAQNPLPQMPAPVAPPPPDVNNVTGMSQPEGPKVNKKLIILIVVGVALILIIGGGAYLFSSGKLSGLGKAPTPTPAPVLQPITTPAPETEQGVDTEGWNTFSKEGIGFTFMYPPDLEYREYEDGSHSISKWGPTQTEATEFFDGISMSFKAGDTEGLTLIEWVNNKYEELKGVFEVSTPEVSQIAGLSAYKMHVKGIVEADYYYLAFGTSSYLEIIDATKDPGSLGFAQTVQGILSSVKLN